MVTFYCKNFIGHCFLTLTRHNGRWRFGKSVINKINHEIYRILKLMHIKFFIEFEKVMASIYYEEYGESKEGGTAKQPGE